MLDIKALAVPTAADNTEQKILGAFIWKIPHRLGACTIECRSCGALHWMEESAIVDRKLLNISFSSCCQKDKVTLPVVDDSYPGYPLSLQSLFMGETEGELPLLISCGGKLGITLTECSFRVRKLLRSD
jgi:hypothetical protein